MGVRIDFWDHIWIYGGKNRFLGPYMDLWRLKWIFETIYGFMEAKRDFWEHMVAGDI